MSSANITLKDIIERKIAYAKNERDNAVPIDFSVTDPYHFTYEEFIAMHDTEIKAFEEMLEDIEIMSEEEFTEKYIAIAKTLGKQIEEEQDEKYNKIAEAKANGTDIYEVLREFPSSGERVWYNNALAEILILFDMKNQALL